MNDYQKTINSWNNLAAAYEAQFMNIHLYDDSYDYFLALIKSDRSKVLEIGCGPGNITRYLIKNRPDLVLTATDVSPKMIERARLNAPSALFQIIDGRDLSSLNEIYDAIICGFTLPYLSVSDRKKFFYDCSGLLPKKGILYFSFIDDKVEKSVLTQDDKGNTMRFYYHNHQEVCEDLQYVSLVVKKKFTIPFKKKDGSSEVHSVVVCKKD